MLGLGTFQAKPGEVAVAVKAAVRSGQRLIDCASGYGNQAEIGDALAELFAEGVCQRNELFIVSKLFQTHHVWDGDASRCEASLQQTLSDLKLDYIDLFWFTGHSRFRSRDWKNQWAPRNLCGSLTAHQIRSGPSRSNTLPHGAS